MGCQRRFALPAVDLFLRHVPLFVSDTQPSPLLLDPNIRKQIFPVRHLAIPFDDAKSVVRHDSDVSVIIDSEAMPILLHGMHLKHPRLEPSLNLSFVGRAAIHTRLSDVLGIILHDPIDRLGAASQKPRNLLVLYFHYFLFDGFGLRPGYFLRANSSRERKRQYCRKNDSSHRVILRISALAIPMLGLQSRKNWKRIAI